MKNLSLTLAVALNAAFGDSLSARLVYAWTDEELFAKSDFVVIAEPISATHDTDEGTNLDDIGTSVIGVATNFETLLVLKGQEQDCFVLHHYRLLESDVVILNGPTLVEFNPSTAHRPYLLFLVREPDGRFAPVSGQTDPAFSVIDLSEPGH
jgi:hypothetical protein